MTTADTESRIAQFVARYSPEIAARLEACRRKVRKLIPRGFELVYDNYNALVFGFGPSEKSSEAVLSIAAYPRWITLFFLDGVRLDDPRQLLRGAGSRVRSVVLATPAHLDRAEIRSLISQALAPVATALADSPKLRTVIKSVSPRQRPRRPPPRRASAPRATKAAPRRSAK